MVTDWDAANREIEELRAENSRLRAALAFSKSPCVYCSLPAEEWAKCQSGFPGCARADDATGCPELGAMMERDDLQKALESEREKAEALQRVFEQGEADSKRAVERWKAKHPDRADEWPEKTDLLVFVMELLDEAEVLLGMQRAALKAVIHAYGSQYDGGSGGMDKAIAQAKLVVGPVDTSDIPEAGEDFFMSAKLRTPSDPM